MRGTVGNLSVSLQLLCLETRYNPQQGIRPESCYTMIIPIGGSSRAPIVFPQSRKTSVICQADHGSHQY